MIEVFERLAANWVAVTLFPLAIFMIFLLHEAAHYVVARAFGVKVLSFTIGLGPKLRQWTDKRGTVWAVHLSPLCGMVQLAGQERHGDAVMSPDMYCARPVWQRALIVAAGPAVNIALAFILIGGFYVAAGIPSARPEVAGVEVGSIAEKAGLQPGDMITHVNGRPVTQYAQVRYAINKFTGSPIIATVQRGEDTQEITVVPEEVRYVMPRGFKRVHGRIGGLSPEKPLTLDAVHSVDGVDTKNDAAKARAELLRRAGDVVMVGLYSTDGSTRTYRARVNGAFMEDHPDSVFFAAWPAVFYDQPGIASALNAAGRDTMRLIAGTVNIARQMFPVDAALFRPEVRPVRAQAPVWHDIFILLYISALWSIFVAFFNLLPVPRLDGGELMMLGAEAALGVERAKVLAPYIMRGALLVCFGVLAFFHAGDFMTYMKLG